MRTLVLLVFVLLATSCGPNHGVQLKQDTPSGTAMMYHTKAVDVELANKVFQAMLRAKYNFGKLTVQLDKVDDRLTLRTCHDNVDAIDSIIKDGDEDGAIGYSRGLARHISKAIDNQEIDVELCRLTLADPFYTVKWKAPE